MYCIKESTDCYVSKVIFTKLANCGPAFFKMAAKMVSNLLEIFRIRLGIIKNIDIEVLHFQINWMISFIDYFSELDFVLGSDILKMAAKVASILSEM